MQTVEPNPTDLLARITRLEQAVFGTRTFPSPNMSVLSVTYGDPRTNLSVQAASSVLARPLHPFPNSAE